MEILKKLLKKNVKVKNWTWFIYKNYKTSKNFFKTFIFAFKSIFLTYYPDYKLNRGLQIEKSFQKVKIRNVQKRGFVFCLDPYNILFYNKTSISNITIDYEIILKNSIEDLKKKYEELAESSFKNNQILAINAIEMLLDKEITAIKKSNKIDKNKYIVYLENIKNKKADSFEEALQRILFYNQVLWQTGHTLNGLGRLDKILINYYINDINNKKLTEAKSRKIIDNFIITLHSYWKIKSNTLLGDTGQIIVLGGTKLNGEYFCNKLTYLFIDEIKKMQLPDPKILLRVSTKTPKDLIKLSLECMKTGIGSPLFANDEIIIPKLIDFGYKKEDSYNYVTSACWEPLISNKSVEQNNCKSIIFMKPFDEMLNSEKLDEIKNIDQLIEKYKKHLKKYLVKIINEIDQIEYECDPILSLFIPNCLKVRKDVSEGGSIYNNCGATTVSLANVVNSIININQFVFEEKKYKLSELNNIRKTNYENYEEVLSKLKNSSNRFGNDNQFVISLFNSISDYANLILSKYTNQYGGHLKIGYSSPSYITDSTNCKASLDGRKNDEPFIVHISSDIQSLPYTELFNFASKLDYSGNRFNGNVVDFMVTPSFIDANEGKFIDFLMLNIKAGYFEMQMNVISSSILIMAKNDPKKFPNLIVRVWGFSAYFNDLPLEYKNILIERALKNEGKIN